MAEAFVCAPLIDAYRQQDDIPFKTFKLDLVAHAVEWGEAAIGRFALSGLEPPRFNDKSFVLAVGHFDGRSYAAVGGLDTAPRVVEYDWPGDWDVT